MIDEWLIFILRAVVLLLCVWMGKSVGNRLKILESEVKQLWDALRVSNRDQVHLIQALHSGSLVRCMLCNADAPIASEIKHTKSCEFNNHSMEDETKCPNCGDNLIAERQTLVIKSKPFCSDACYYENAHTQGAK